MPEPPSLPLKASPLSLMMTRRYRSFPVDSSSTRRRVPPPGKARNGLAGWRPRGPRSIPEVLRMPAFSRRTLDLRLCPLLFVAALSVTACHESHKSSAAPSESASAEPGKLTPELAKQVLAKVGDREITLGEYAETLERMDPFERLRYQSADRRKQLLNEIIQVQLLADEAKRRGLDKQPETQERLRQMLKDELLRDLRKSVPAPNDIPEAEVHAYFDAHHDEFKEPERRRVSHVVVASETQAKSALQKALGASASDWGKLVTDVSLDKPPKS